MSTFAEKLAAARKNRPTKDVKVLLDHDLAEKREELRAALAQKPAVVDERLGKKTRTEEMQAELDDLERIAQESIITLRFTRMSGTEWTELTSHFPVRPDVPLDRQYGYNVDAVCRAAARRSGVRLEGDQEVALVVQAKTKDTPKVDEWADIFDVLSGGETNSIRDAIFELNEYDQQARLSALVKGSGAATSSATN